MNKPSYGVIVGRFQVNDLHDGHMELFREVMGRHNRVIVFVGVAPTEITQTNPLSFEARKKMIQAKFPSFTVLPIKDQGNDAYWSKILDQKIAEVADYGEVTLYGGRDSFVPHYSGHYKPVELCLHGSPSGTVDIIIMRNAVSGNGLRDGMVITPHVLLAQKPGETLWRFVGGFADVDSESYEDDAKREAYEETGLDINSLQYIGSTRINDWRYREVPDKIKTLVF